MCPLSPTCVRTRGTALREVDSWQWWLECYRRIDFLFWGRWSFNIRHALSLPAVNIVIDRDVAEFDYGTKDEDRGEVAVDKTSVYADSLALQKALVTLYIFLPLWLVVLVSLVSPRVDWSGAHRLHGYGI